jgi:hypothetical protein
MTPLMLAVATDRQDKAVIRMLLEYGATFRRRATWETGARLGRRVAAAPALSCWGSNPSRIHPIARPPPVSST